MESEGSITQWLEQLKNGQEDAVQPIWERYYRRLVGLARQKLQDTPRRISDEEDVVIDAFASFCRGAEAGRFPKLNDREDLWQVLVMITARKTVNQMKHDSRQKRGGGQVRGESVFGKGLSDDERAGIDKIVGQQPTPEFAGLVSLECEELLQRLDDETLVGIAVAKLEGYTNEEIAIKLDVRTRTVERKVRTIREIWSVEE